MRIGRKKIGDSFVRLGLSVISGLLLAASWPPHPFYFLIFGAFVPIMWVWLKERSILKIWGYSFITFLIWNVSSTWWLINATLPGGIFAMIANSFLMTIPFVVSRWIRKKLNLRLGWIGLISGWLAFEHFHFNWEAAWPWLTVGHVFATMPSVVQWYEFTGPLGGTLWVLLLNVLFVGLIYPHRKKIMRGIYASLIVVFLSFPVIYSFWTYNHYFCEGEGIKALVIQPNIDPYGEKFYIPSDSQVLWFLELARPYLSNDIDVIVLPETAIPGGIWIHELDSAKYLKPLKELLDSFPDLEIVTGASLLEMYPNQATHTARCPKHLPFCYDAYNSALLIARDTIMVYHKNILVAGVERMPYSEYLPFLNELVIDLGGISGSLGTSENNPLFPITRQANTIALGIPAICYESIFPEYLSLVMSNKGNILLVITNDGWWGDTDGYKQHFLYGRLTAVTLRKWIVRSANTGISGIINSRGDVLIETEFWVPDAFVGTASTCDKITFFAQNGHFIGRFAWVAIAVLIGVALVTGLTNKFRFNVKKLRPSN